MRCRRDQGVRRPPYSEKSAVAAGETAMSSRANSFRCVLLDGFCFVAVTGLFATVLTAFAYGATPPVGPPIDNADVAADRRLTDDHIDSQLNTDDNMPSGTQNESVADEIHTNILGMTLKELRAGYIYGGCCCHVAGLGRRHPSWRQAARDSRS
jgi:hypothetical protein